MSYIKKLLFVLAIILIFNLIGCNNCERQGGNGSLSSISVDTDSSKDITDKQVNNKFDLVKAKRAAVVAITNALADDVFASDGNTIDTSKFHSYNDLTGFYLIVNDWGEWTGISEISYHVKNLKLKIQKTAMEIVAEMDVSYNSNYLISNLKGKYGVNVDLSSIETSDSNSQLYLSVPDNLVSEDRDEEAARSGDITLKLDKYDAQQAFEDFGKLQYPYGFKCHWILDLSFSHQDPSTGSWTFKVGVTITNQYGVKYKATADGKVSGTSENPIVEDFLVN